MVMRDLAAYENFQSGKDDGRVEWVKEMLKVRENKGIVSPCT